jgi:hypothetical protein
MGRLQHASQRLHGPEQPRATSWLLGRDWLSRADCRAWAAARVAVRHYGMLCA